MEIFYLAVGLGILAFFAHVVKGVTGFGPAVVFVSIGSLIYDPVKVIVVASLLDVIGGGYLTALNPQFLLRRHYWVPMGVFMVSGAVVGSVALSIVPPDLFEQLLGVSIVMVSLWFISGRAEPMESSDENVELRKKDGLAGIFSGFCGGFTGMGGPPLVAYLGAKFDRDLFRSLVVPIFLMSTLARFSTYGFLGMTDSINPLIFMVPPVGVVAGNHLGNYFFEEFDQQVFTVIVGVILMLSGLRLLIG